MATNRNKKPTLKVVEPQRSSMAEKIIFFLLFIPWILWQIIRVSYLLLIGFPNKKSNFIGLIRVVFWGFILYHLFSTPENLGYSYLPQSKWDAFVSNVDINYGVFIKFLVAVAPFIMAGIFIVSIAVMFGMHSNLQLGNDDGEYHNVQATMRIMDTQLSSYKTKSDFINKFLGIK